MQIKLIAVNARYSHSCPALFYVRNEIERHVTETHIILHQFTINDPFFSTLVKISANQPDAVFFSVYIWNFEYMMRLVNDIARILPDTRVILGGPQVISLDPSALPQSCTIVRGEIEGVPASFYQDLRENRLHRLYQSGTAGRFPCPYRDADFPGELRNRYVYFESSRGCPFACTYCLSSIEKVRYKDAALVKEELGVILNHSPGMVRFIDRTFNARPERALHLWQFLSDAKTNTIFHFEIAPDLFTEEMFRFLETLPPGRFQFEIGIQSTTPLTLKAINRTMNIEASLVNISRLVSLDNIHVHVDLILGLPHETPLSFRKSFCDVFSVFPHYIQMGLLKILPGAPIERSTNKFGLVHRLNPPYEILATHGMDHESLTRLYWFGECVEAFFNNRYFRTFFNYVRKVEKDPFDFFDGLLDRCLSDGFFDLSKTQELMSGILFSLANERPDRELMHELLIFDWLKSGHRFLPGHFPVAPVKSIRDRLWRQMPQNLAPYYSYSSRDEFFKQGVFLELSGQALKETGLATGKARGCVCFLPETLPGVLKLQKVILLSANNNG